MKITIENISHSQWKLTMPRASSTLPDHPLGGLGSVNASLVYTSLPKLCYSPRVGGSGSLTMVEPPLFLPQ